MIKSERKKLMKEKIISKHIVMILEVTIIFVPLLINKVKSLKLFQGITLRVNTLQLTKGI